MKGFIKKLLEEISDTSMLYWTDTPGSLPAIIALLSTSAFLLILGRWVWNPGAGGEIDLITALLSFMMQLIACLAYLLRGGYGAAGDEVPKFLRLLVVVWILSLFFSLHNLFPPLNIADVFHPAVMALLYSIPAAALLAYVTICRGKRSSPPQATPYRTIFLWTLFVTGINTLLFFLFVSDWHTNYFLKTHLKSLSEIIKKYV